MGKQFDQLQPQHVEFIDQQKMFFVATATADSRINLSPKGLDAFRVLGPNRVIWLNLTGSGNETAAHIKVDPRMTVMFNAFEGKPIILRLYGTAEVCHQSDKQWEELSGHFPKIAGARQVFDMNVQLVQSSCGMGVPLYEYQGQRTELVNWADKIGPEGVKKYWSEKNRVSIDHAPTGIDSSL